MFTKLAGLFLVGGLLLGAAEKKSPAITRGENEDLILDVTLYDDPTLVKELLGTELSGHYIVAAVKVEPKYGKEIIVDRDDFQLRTSKDGEHTTPFAASQIFATDAITVSHAKGAPAASPGMVLAGPLVIHGGPAATGQNENGEAKAGDGAAANKEEPPAKQEDPLKKMLDERALPEKKTGDAVSGLLYFPMEKQKRKDLELLYGGRENRITLRFK